MHIKQKQITSIHWSLELIKSLYRMSKPKADIIKV